MSELRRSGKCVNKPDINAKSYKITTPSGEQVIVKNLTKWSKENGFNSSSVRNVASGLRDSHFGYRIEAA
jgi:hypothetical protein